MNTAPSHTVSCTCGTTRFVCDGPHIIVTECYCDSCRKAAAILEALPDAPKVLEPSSGTWFVLHRKDRIKPITSTEHLREHRLTPESSTRRIVATCCNAPMFLDLPKAIGLASMRGGFRRIACPRSKSGRCCATCRRASHHRPRIPAIQADGRQAS
jgi:hypothetical protein